MSIRAACFALLLSLLSCPVCCTAADPPNVIIFIADDVSWNDYGCYGNEHARTPHIDSLAEGGLRFTQAFLTASSCSPSRSSIITGRYPHNNGKAAELHQPISGHLPWFPEQLRASGYYTALVGKNHMRSTTPRPKSFDLIDPGKGPGNSGGHATWVKTIAERPRDKPFFCWFAAYDAHRGWDADRQWDEERYGPPHKPNKVTVPPFLIDDAQTRQDLASYYNEVTRFDHYIGEVVAELKQQGAYDNTLLFVLADNGRPFPRAKTRLHDSGMKTALVAHWPAGIKPAVCDQLVSVIDLAPTILGVAGQQKLETMQGLSLLPLFNAPSRPVRNYAFSEHNWHDYEAHGRSIRDGRFLFLQNARPQLPWQGPADSVRSPSHKALLASRANETLEPAQADVFLAPRPPVELYDTINDPHQLHNLVANPSYKAHHERLRKHLNWWSEATADSVPEHISPDTFDRVTGNRLKGKKPGVTLTPGEDVDADKVNEPGPH